jgi:diaminopropionate ammonia-lyase
VFLHTGVPAWRARRIEAQGAELVRVDGTYDDAVEAALAAVRAGAGILVADATTDPADPVVADVIAGYRVIASEIRQQVEVAGHQRPTHLFIQAGVGGLAAAMAEGLKGWLAPPAALLVVEPEGAACVAAALVKGSVVRVPGDLSTVAEMLSCGEASAPAIVVLRANAARSVIVSETSLADAPVLLRNYGGPRTTPSGAAGLAGVSTVLASPGAALEIAISTTSRVLIVVTEAEVGEDVFE